MVIVREEARSLCIFVYEDACKIKGEKWNMIKNIVFPTAFLCVKIKSLRLCGLIIDSQSMKGVLHNCSPWDGVLSFAGLDRHLFI